MTARAAVALAIALFAGSGVSARSAISQVPVPRQDSAGAESRITEGDRIRFVAPPEFPDLVSGRVTSFEDGVLVVYRRRDRGGPAEVRLADLSQLEVSVDQKPQTLPGLAIGSGVGLVIGGLMAWAYCDGPDNACSVDDAATITAVVAAPFAALGALFGSLSRKDVWEELPLP